MNATWGKPNKLPARSPDLIPLNTILFTKETQITRSCFNIYFGKRMNHNDSITALEIWKKKTDETNNFSTILLPCYPLGSGKWYSFLVSRERGRCSGESTRLPPMCPGFDSRTRCRMWVEFVGSLLCSDRFFPGFSGFPLSPKTHIWICSVVVLFDLCTTPQAIQL